jgi:hypothetical protein
MEPTSTIGYKPRSREEILAWLQRAREIKERKQREAEEMYAEQQRRKKDVAESEYYNFDWWE